MTDELFKTSSACRECKRKDKLIINRMCFNCKHGGVVEYKLTAPSSFVLDKNIVKR